MSKESRIYVGGLPTDVRSADIEDIFYKYGRIVDIDLKSRRPAPFAFVEFEDPRDAEDAVRGRDGYDFDGYRLRVEVPRGRGGGRGGGNSDRYSDRYNDRPRFGYMGRGGRGPPPRKGDYRVVVTGIPSTGSWQDLKDHMREAGDVTFTDVYRDGTGVVEFSRRSDMEYALKNLDDTKFKSHEGETGFIRIREEGSGGGRNARSYSRSRSRSPRSPRSRSRSYSPRRSPSRSRSPSPRSAAPARSRSPSPL